MNGSGKTKHTAKMIHHLSKRVTKILLSLTDGKQVTAQSLYQFVDLIAAVLIYTENTIIRLIRCSRSL